MSLVKTKNKSFHFVCDQENLALDKTKLLIGSSNQCDIVIQHDSVSPIHALLFYKDNQWNIMDLESTNGIFRNGIKIEKSEIQEDESINIGEKVFQLYVKEDEVTELSNVEESITEVYKPETTEFVIDTLPNDFKFDEQSTVFTDTPLLNSSLEFSYVDLNEGESFEDPTVKGSDELCLQVNVLCNGYLLDLQHHRLENSFYLNKGKNSLNIEGLPTLKEAFINKVSDNQLDFIALEGYELLEIENNQIKTVQTASLNGQNKVIVSRGSFQVMFSLAPLPNSLKKAPFFVLDQEFKKELAKVFGAIVLPMLLLLFLDASPPGPPKEIAVVYKRETPVKTDSNQFKSDKVAKKDTGNNGKQLKKKERAARKQQPKKVAKSQPKKSQATKQVKKKVAVVKTYKFRAPTNMNSLFNNSNSESKVVQNNTAQFDNSIETVNHNSVQSLKSKMIKISKVGTGSGRTNYGVAGLSSKKGFETATIGTKTVILGSMDPELLRKILQEYIPQFRHCYQKELNHNSDDIKGIIDLNFRILGSGKVGKIDIKTKKSQFSRGGVDCMAKVLAIIPFPKPKGGGIVDVRQPLNFTTDTKRVN